MDLVSRRQAKDAGLKRYFTGKPCARSHVNERLTSSTRCVECHRQYERQRTITHPAKQASGRNKWRGLNKEKVLAKGREYRANNRDIMRQKFKDWTRANPEKARLRGRRRRARLRGASGHHSYQDIRSIFLAQNKRCAYCKTRLDERSLTVDHITALNRGGSNNKTNLQIVCYSCNSRKKDRDPIAFAQSIGMLI